jgi:hypothetical protein
MKRIFPVFAIFLTVLCTGCYGPGYMTSTRHHYDGWNRPTTRAVHCDAYNGITFNTPD